MESKEIGMNSDVAVGLWNVGMGTTDEIFQLDGGRQHLMERFKRLGTEGAIASIIQLLTLAYVLDH